MYILIIKFLKKKKKDYQIENFDSFERSFSLTIAGIRFNFEYD